LTPFRTKATKQQKAKLEGEVVQNAGAAKSYAEEAIEFTPDAIDDAKDAVLDALQAQATANALVHAISSASRLGRVFY